MEKRKRRKRKKYRPISSYKHFTLWSILFWGIEIGIIFSGLYLFFTLNIYYSDYGKEFISKFDYGTYEGKLVNECNATNFYLRKIDKELNEIPSVILDDYYDKGGVITIVDSIEDTLDYPDKLRKLGTLSGVYRLSTNQIYMRYVYYQTDDVVHEIGHFVDHNYSVCGEEWKEIYNEEKEFFLTRLRQEEYSISKDTEYWAESFKEYIYRPDRLKRCCPMTYSFVDKTLNKIYDI